LAPSIASSETLAPSTLDLPTVFTATAKHHACQMPAYEQWVSLATTTPWRRTEEIPNRLMSFPLSQITILSKKNTGNYHGAACRFLKDLHAGRQSPRMDRYLKNLL